MRSRRTDERPGRNVAVANGVVAVVVVLVLAAMSLLANPPSPPSIAEFSPQAEQQIEQAPAEQSADAGAGVGGRPATVIIEESEAAAEVAGTGGRDVLLETAPSALQCVTWPDGSVTQTFDPQSPPCIATWDADAGNGGATSMGVTATEILVAVPGLVDEDHVLEAFFNSAYQFYGRRIRLVNVPVTSALTSEGRLATAQAAKEMQPFAATNLGAGYGSPATWENALADAGIITVAADHALLTLQGMRAHAPYQWLHSPPSDVIVQYLATFVCGSLAGRDATYAGPGSTGPRKWTILHELSAASRPTYESLQQRLAACGVEAPIVDFDTDGDYTAMFAELKSSGVTTIITQSATGTTSVLWTGADRLGYQPEWIMPGLGQNQYVDYYPPPYSRTQASHLFGLATSNKFIADSIAPWTQAQRSADPGMAHPEYRRHLYRQLSILAAGIQMAGPNLTPDSFAEGLRSTRFPNPGAGEAPFYQARADFSLTPSLIDDLGVFWYSTTQTNSESGSAGGGMCWVERGRRWSLADFPADLRLFSGDCR